MSKRQELVIFVHGFAGKRIWMQPLMYRLRKAYAVMNWGYLSIVGSVDSHARRFHEFLQGIDYDGPINIVAHSMGSIVTRAALQLGKIPELKRIVFLAPPNSGSPIARAFGNVIGWACQPISDLSSDQGSYVNSISPALPYETGIIAAKYDMLVPVNSTFLQQQADHITIPGTHNSLLFSSYACQLVIRFLQHGSFALPNHQQPKA